MKRFHVELVILDSEDASELKKSLPESLLLVAPISEKESLALVIGSVDQSERITKSLRSFDVRPITIPKDLPQRPDLAFQEIGARKIQIDEEIKKTALKTMEAVKGINDNILGLREAADVAYSGTGGTQKIREARSLFHNPGLRPDKARSGA